MNSHTCVCGFKMSLTVHVYCNGVEQGDIDIVYDEDNESLNHKITKELGIQNFIFEKGFDIATVCQDDNIYIERDTVMLAISDVNSYLDNSELRFLVGDEAFIISLINANMVNTLKDEYENDALYWASRYGHSNNVRLLILAGADVNAINHYIVINDGVNVDGNNDYPNNYGMFEFIARFPHWSNEETSLYRSTIAGHGDIVQMLIDAGADVNYKNWAGMSVLFWASYRGYYDVVEFLIKGGVDINHSYDSINALTFAEEGRHTEVIQLLKDSGAINIHSGCCNMFNVLTSHCTLS